MPPKKAKPKPMPPKKAKPKPIPLCPYCKAKLTIGGIIVYREMKSRYTLDGYKLGETEPAVDPIDIECVGCRRSILKHLEKNDHDLTPFYRFGE